MRENREGVRKGVTLILTKEAGRDEKKGLCTRITLHLEMEKKTADQLWRERIRVSRPTACSLYFSTRWRGKLFTRLWRHIRLEFWNISIGLAGFTFRYLCIRKWLLNGLLVGGFWGKKGQSCVEWREYRYCYPKSTGYLALQFVQWNE